MKTSFFINSQNVITQANINFYSSPLVHPSRIMQEHDFIYIINGKWKIGQEAEVFDLKNDSLLILSANKRHYGVSPCEKNTKTMYFHVKCSLPKNTEQKDAIFLESLTNASSNKNLKKLFSEVVNAKLLGNEQKADLYFKLLLLELQAEQKSSFFGNMPDKIKKLIHDNPETFFSNKQIADMSSVSVKTAENKFKEAFNVSIHKYMLQFKIAQAEKYFSLFPEMPIKEVAISLGFYDEYHFSNQFKKIKGVSPKKFKNSLL